MNIYVGNLDYQITEEDLRDIFEDYGKVSSVKLIIDRDSNRSKGFGFVEMEESEDGQKAIQELDGAKLEGRTMRVNQAREKTQQRRNNFQRNDRRGGDRGGYSHSNDRDNNRW